MSRHPKGLTGTPMVPVRLPRTKPAPYTVAEAEAEYIRAHNAAIREKRKKRREKKPVMVLVGGDPAGWHQETPAPESGPPRGPRGHLHL
jgi:hypothetical protein